QQTFVTDSAAMDIAVGDLDGDGKPDIVIANHGAYTVSVFRNTTAGGVFSVAAKANLNVNTAPYRVRLADSDGDGKLDILTTNHLDFGNIFTGDIFRNTSTPGSIAFDPEVNFYPAGPYSRA